MRGGRTSRGRSNLSVIIVLLTVLLFSSAPALSGGPSDLSSKSADSERESGSWLKNIEAEWGGHFKIHGGTSWPGSGSVFKPVGTGTFLDGNIDVRLKNRLYFGELLYLETHYELMFLGGDTWRKSRQLQRLYPDLPIADIVYNLPIDDESRLLDLSKIISETDDYVVYNRIDRLSLTWLPNWGMVRVGRQAITWGNGFLFNPMDLFNPFSPTDVERDYKTGDDIALVQFPYKDVGDLQLLYVARRNPNSRKLDWNSSSLAAKLKLSWGTVDIDFMGAKHYQDAVFGMGSSGYLGDVAWRMDAVWTFLHDKQYRSGYLSLVANVDYSWVAWRKNWYGFMEFFYSGVGESDYTEALADPEILEKLSRGELFTLGKFYLSGNLRWELHPLFNIYLTVINNLQDPSGIVQPRAVWDVTEDLQLYLGGNIFYGAQGTEYGGFAIPGTDLSNKPADSIYLWLNYYF